MPGETFPRALRLLKPLQYTAVFGFRRVLRGQYFLLHYGEEAVTSAAIAPSRAVLPRSPLDTPEPGQSARLGLVVGKKFMRTAVGRNVIKRMTREIFRRRRASLPARDWVLRLAVKLDKPDAMMRQILASDIQSLFDRAMAREVLKRMPDSPVKGLTLKGKPQIPQAGTARKTRDNRDGSTPPVMLLAHS